MTDTADIVALVIDGNGKCMLLTRQDDDGEGRELGVADTLAVVQRLLAVKLKREAHALFDPILPQ
jgi:hypothetical protein